MNPVPSTAEECRRTRLVIQTCSSLLLSEALVGDAPGFCRVRRRQYQPVTGDLEDARQALSDEVANRSRLDGHNERAGGLVDGDSAVEGFVSVDRVGSV